MRVLVEACVDSVEAALAAEQGGADRLELCANLDVGGTTPPAVLIDQVRDTCRLPVHVMIRPRGGDFRYGAAELSAMRADIELARLHGASGLVFGALTADGRVDEHAMRALMVAAGTLPVTFHKAFDLVPDPVTALERLEDIGVARVLTSGGAPTAREGIATLGLLAARGGRVTIMAGGAVRGENVGEIVARTGIREVHARSERHPARLRAIRSALDATSQ